MKKGVEAIMSNHMFNWAGRTYLQEDGGSIGLRLTGSTCRVVMDRWLREFKSKTMVSNIELLLIAKYVDDMNIFTYAVEKGLHWVGGKNGRVIHTDERESLDREKERTESIVTMELIKDIANSINPLLKVTSDTIENNDNMTIPMLDVQAWRTCNNTEICHKFYEKSVASRKVMGKKTALPIKTKIATLSQEVARRMTNTGRDVSIETRIEILDKE